MIYPIVAYGDPILRRQAAAIEKNTDMRKLAHDMLATMKLAQGVGLAAPQIGKSIRLIVIESLAYLGEKCKEDRNKEILVNPMLKVDTSIALTRHEEGCLSIPNILIEVPRYERVFVSYFDVNWKFHEDEWTGLPARVLQHEYDHLQGILHIDYASPLKKRLIQRRLAKISKGKVNVFYPMSLPSDTPF